jgi:hypothetical protein
LVVCCTCQLIACNDGESPDVVPAATNLWQFAQANCLFQFFEKKGWELDDIGAISGGYVELGHSGPDTYAAISEIVSNWQPPIATKQDIDVDLLKCFRLRDNKEIQALIVRELR